MLAVIVAADGTAVDEAAEATSGNCCLKLASSSSPGFWELVLETIACQLNCWVPGDPQICVADLEGLKHRARAQHRECSSVLCTWWVGVDGHIPLTKHGIE